MTELDTAWVLCSVLGRDDLVTCAPAEQRALEAGALRCPVCTLTCKPKVRAVGVLAGRTTRRWRDGAWQP